MDGFITWQCPVPSAILEKAYEKLREHQVLVGAFDYSQQSTYDAKTYLVQQALHRTELFVLVDRNLFSTAKDFALGKKLSDGNRERLGALMVVAMAHHMLFEPCIAVCEYADTHDNAAAFHDLQIFRHADNISIETYARLLDGKLDRLPLPERFAGNHCLPTEGHDLTAALKTWNFNYPLVLKIAQLERAPLKPHERMQAYLKWMWSDYVFSGPATAFGVMFLSSGKCGHKKMIKNLHGTDKDRRTSGLRNACWDLCLLQEWLKLLREQGERNRLWLLASADKALVHAARRLGTSQPLDEQQLIEVEKQSFIEAWGAENGVGLYRQYRSLWDSLDSPDRAANSPGFSRKYCEQLVRDLESTVTA